VSSNVDEALCRQKKLKREEDGKQDLESPTSRNLMQRIKLQPLWDATKMNERRKRRQAKCACVASYLSLLKLFLFQLPLIPRLQIGEPPRAEITGAHNRSQQNARQNQLCNNRCICHTRCLGHLLLLHARLKEITEHLFLLESSLFALTTSLPPTVQCVLLEQILTTRLNQLELERICVRCGPVSEEIEKESRSDMSLDRRFYTHPNHTRDNNIE
jgi:hypothetical protein